jgi:hypothetical protein
MQEHGKFGLKLRASMVTSRWARRTFRRPDSEQADSFETLIGFEALIRPPGIFVKAPHSVNFITLRPPKPLHPSRISLAADIDCSASKKSPKGVCHEGSYPFS